MTIEKATTTKADLSALELKTLVRVSRPGPYVGLNGKALQRLIQLGLVKTLVAGYALTDEGIQIVRS